MEEALNQFWSRRQKLNNQLIEIFKHNCGEITFSDFDDKTSALQKELIDTLIYYFSNSKMTYPDALVYNGELYKITNISISDIDSTYEIHFQLTNEAHVESYLLLKKNCIRGKSVKPIFLTRFSEIYDVTLIWFPNYNSLYNVFSKLDLFDEMNLIDVILNYLPFRNNDKKFKELYPPSDENMFDADVIRTVMKHTGSSRKNAIEALKKCDGDIVDAIIEL